MSDTPHTTMEPKGPVEALIRGLTKEREIVKTNIAVGEAESYDRSYERGVAYGLDKALKGLATLSEDQDQSTLEQGEWFCRDCNHTVRGRVCDACGAASDWPPTPSNQNQEEGHGLTRDDGERLGSIASLIADRLDLRNDHIDRAVRYLRKLSKGALTASPGEGRAQKRHKDLGHSASDSFRRCPDPGCQIEAAQIPDSKQKGQADA